MGRFRLSDRLVGGVPSVRFAPLGQIAGTYTKALRNEEIFPGTAVRKPRTWVMLSLGRLER
jgi:hypothetical protein